MKELNFKVKLKRGTNKGGAAFRYEETDGA